MKIGVPKEVKDQEARVGLIPSSVKALCDEGHEVVVQSSAGLAIGYTDQMYIQAGAHIVDSLQGAYDADLVVKIKEPQEQEYAHLSEQSALFTFLHLAADPVLSQALLNQKVTSIAYETVTAPDGSLPLLTPMSQIAGRVGVQAGSYFLQKPQGGSGVLLGAIPGADPATVTILGAGAAGYQALQACYGLGCLVKAVDINEQRLEELKEEFGDRLEVIHKPSEDELTSVISASDLVVGTVLIPGQAAPKLISRSMVKQMRQGSVVVDISIDQGGCIETSKATTHSDPIHKEEGILHYCVTNMPAACARTASDVLNHLSLPYVLNMAKLGVESTLAEDPHLKNGLNTFKGACVHEDVAKACNLPFESVENLL